MSPRSVLLRRRRGFLFTMPLMLGIGILFFASMIAISQMFVTVGGPMIPDLLADMPTIFRYTEDGQRVPEHVPLLTAYPAAAPGGEAMTEAEFSEAFPSLAMYGLMVRIALGIFAVLLMLAGISYFFEEFNVVRKGTAYGMVARMLVLVPIYLVLPYLWDSVAVVVESSSLYLMDPFGGDPHKRTTELWCMIGSVTCSVGGTTVDPVEIFGADGGFDRNSTLTHESWSRSLQEPVFGEDFAINVMLSLFKGFAVMFMTAMMFVLSAIRVMLIEVIIVAFPLVTAIGLIPWINTKRISDMFQQNLIGLSVAPIMSAVSLSVGLSTVDAQDMPPLRMWFQLLSVGFISVFFPVMLSPMLGNISTKVGSMVSTSITSASVAGSNALKGATQGLSQASSLADGGMMRAGAQAAGGAGRHASAAVGSATSGALAGAGLSPLARAGMYARAGALGALGGLGSGMVQAASRGVGAGAAAGPLPGYMMHAGDSRIAGVVHGAAAGGLAREAGSVMADIEVRAASAAPPVISRSTLMNPGGGLDAMAANSDSFDEGRRLVSDPAARAEFAKMYAERNGMAGMPPGAAKQLEQRLSEQIAAHPTAAGSLSLNLRASAERAAAEAGRK